MEQREVVGLAQAQGGIKSDQRVLVITCAVLAAAFIYDWIADWRCVQKTGEYGCPEEVDYSFMAHALIYAIDHNSLPKGIWAGTVTRVVDTKDIPGGAQLEAVVDFGTDAFIETGSVLRRRAQEAADSIRRPSMSPPAGGEEDVREDAPPQSLRVASNWSGLMCLIVPDSQESRSLLEQTWNEEQRDMLYAADFALTDGFISPGAA